MEKSNTISKVLAIIAFATVAILANSFQVMAVLVLAGLFLISAIVLKDNKGSSDILSAGLLYVANGVLVLIIAEIQQIINFFLYCADKMQNPKGLLITFDIIFFVIWLAVVVFSIMAILRLFKNKVGSAPILSIITNKLLGVTAPGTWTCTCGKNNKGNFCAGCGSKKPEDAE